MDCLTCRGKRYRQLFIVGTGMKKYPCLDCGGSGSEAYAYDPPRDFNDPTEETFDEAINRLDKLLEEDRKAREEYDEDKYGFSDYGLGFETDMSRRHRHRGGWNHNGQVHYQKSKNTYHPKSSVASGGSTLPDGPVEVGEGTFLRERLSDDVPAGGRGIAGTRNLPDVEPVLEQSET